MDIIAIRTTEDFLKKNRKNTALIHLNGGQSYETRNIYKIIQPSVATFEPFLIIDAHTEGDDLVILPTSAINHIVIKGPEKEKKVGFFIRKTQ